MKYPLKIDKHAVLPKKENPTTFAVGFSNTL